MTKRLKAEAGHEAVAGAVPRQPVVFGPEPEDLLGYPEREPIDAVLHMARDAVAGVNQDLVRQEADRFAKHFGRGGNGGTGGWNVAGAGTPAENDPIFVIMDVSPIVMLSAIERLDWLMEPCGTMYITDMVMEEVTRDPEPGADPRGRWLAYTRSWFTANTFRIRRIETDIFADYQRSRNYGELTIIETLKRLRGEVPAPKTVVVLMDDADGRETLKGVRRIKLDVFSTRAFIEALHARFGIAEAEHAWQAILDVVPAGTPKDDEEEDRPVLC